MVGEPADAIIPAKRAEFRQADNDLHKLARLGARVH